VEEEFSGDEIAEAVSAAGSNLGGYDMVEDGSDAKDVPESDRCFSFLERDEEAGLVERWFGNPYTGRVAHVRVETDREYGAGEDPLQTWTPRIEYVGKICDESVNDRAYELAERLGESVSDYLNG
ncbi:MAG: hypothetical protein ABEJ72_07480, partial [Candidatus Aenigmatarchaeota archaeon]